MNLIVDAGNSFLKLAVFDEYQLVQSETTTYPLSLSLIKTYFKSFAITHSIIASTKTEVSAIIQVLQQESNLHLLSHKSKLPFKNDYKTPHTLGLDRLALIAAAYKKFPNRNCLVIDAGTCVTYDFITANAVYLGGAISPGLEMRFKAMHTFTDKLPLVYYNEQQHKFIGDSTQTAMQAGVQMGLKNEIDGFIDLYMSDYEDLTVILTGGDHQALSTRLKNGIFATSNFLVEGLNFLLAYNIYT